MASEISSQEEGFDQQSEHCGSYSLSVNVSESESSSSFSYRRYDIDNASCCMPLSHLAHHPFIGTPGFPAKLTPPVIGGKMEEDL
ncbi:hypothetical protein LguiA_002322 [Lonicera macranthoides]